jgi:hypothetical protein
MTIGSVKYILLTLAYFKALAMALPQSWPRAMAPLAFG